MAGIPPREYVFDEEAVRKAREGATQQVYQSLSERDGECTLRSQLVTATAAEKVEVLLAGSVAVAVTSSPSGSYAAKLNVKVATPFSPVVTVTLPRNCCPWAEPSEFAKNSNV